MGEGRNIDNRRIDKLFKRLAFALPQRCRLCGAVVSRSSLCAGCRSDLPRAPDHPLRIKNVDVGWACFRYDYPVAMLIHEAKYRHDLGSLRILAGLFVEMHPCTSPQPDLLIPVPLTSERMRHRGFNQAEELCRGISMARGVPIAATLVRRRKGDPPQVGLNAAARRRNVLNAFHVTDRIDAARVVVVDDVTTTGATAASLAATLRSAGAARIEFWACACA